MNFDERSKKMKETINNDPLASKIEEARGETAKETLYTLQSIRVQMSGLMVDVGYIKKNIDETTGKILSVSGTVSDHSRYFNYMKGSAIFIGFVVGGVGFLYTSMRVVNMIFGLVKYVNKIFKMGS